MGRQVVLLRGINVGRANRLAMADLRSVLEEAGATDVVTYLQSGNAVVSSGVPDLASRVEAGLRDDLGLEVRVLVRSADDLGRVVEQNPFPHKVAEPKLLHVAFLEEQPATALVEELGTRHGDDELALGERVLYLSYAKSSQRSPLEPALRRIGGVATARNWTTVTRLVELSTSA
jgi:uncharacterized protein (DUF1697 family)